MKRVAEAESGVVGVPVVVEPVPIPLPPVVEVEVADVQVAIAVPFPYSVPSMPLPSVNAISRQSSGLYFIRGLA